jgi:hypothetical protein
MRGVRKTLELTGLGLLVVVGSAVLTKAYQLKYATPHGHDATFCYQTIGAGAFWLAVTLAWDGGRPAAVRTPLEAGVIDHNL